MNRFDPFEQLVLAAQAVGRAAALLPRPSTWLPWVLLAAIEVLAVAAIAGFAHPWLSWALAPWLAREGGEALLHYPAVFRALPALHGRADLVTGALAAPVTIGAATLAFARRFQSRPAAPWPALGEALRRAPALVLALLPLHLAEPALASAADMAGRRGIAALAASASVPIVGAVVQAAFVYVAALVMLERRGPWASLAALPGTWARGGWAALALGAAAVAARFPIQLLGARVGSIVDRGTPELAVWLTGAVIAAELAVGYVLTGAATLAYLSAVTGERGDR